MSTISPGTLRFGELSSTPSTPPAGYASLYVKTDNVVYILDSSGVETPLGSSSAITSLTGEATAVGPGAAVVTLSNAAVIGKVLTGFVAGPNSTVLATDTLLEAIEKLQAQVTASSGTAITDLTGDVTAVGPGSVSATVNSVGGKTASQISTSVSDTQAATPTNTSSTIVKRDASGNFAASTITANLTGTATNATTSVSFTGSLVGDVTGTQTATVVSTVGGKTASAVATSVNDTQAATPTNTASTIVKRDASGNFSANLITANLSGNATTSTTSTNFTGSLVGDVTGTQGATVVSTVDGYSAAQVGTSVADTQAATSANTASTIVKRDPSGNFSAGTITASLTGNVTGNVSGSSASFTGPLSGDVTGTQSATAIASAVVTGKVLTGYTVGSNTPIAATDTILQAFEKTQGQLNATTGAAITSLTGDVVATGPGAAAATIQPNVVDNSKLAQMPTLTIKGNNTGGTANASDLTVPQVTSMVSSIVVTQLPDQSNFAGTAPYLARADHIHNIPSGVPVQVGTSNVQGSAASFSLSDHVHSHGNQTVGTLHAAVTTSVNGFMSAVDKTKLDAATNLNTPSTIVMRDASGNFSAGTITATLNGSATNFSGSLSGDVTGTQSATLIATGAVTDTKASLAVKPAVTVVATTNQALTGTPTIDGQTTTANQSIVLLTAQSTASQNGPWVVQTGAWTRPTWYPSGGTTQSFQFITTLVRLGTVYGGSVWRQTTAAPVTIDTTSTTWVVTPVSGNYKASYTIGPQSGTAEVDLVFGNSTPATLAWNPTVTHKVTMPPTQGAAGTSLFNDGSGNLSWSSVQTNIDGGRANSVFVIGLNVVGGTA